MPFWPTKMVYIYIWYMDSGHPPVISNIDPCISQPVIIEYDKYGYHVYHHFPIFMVIPLVNIDLLNMMVSP